MLVAIHGTWGSQDTWFLPESPVMQAARRQGCVLPPEPFRWSGQLGSGLSRRPWQLAAMHLRWYLAAYGVPRPNVLSHSHGVQVLAYAAFAEGLSFGRIVDVEGPVVSSIAPAYAALRVACEAWTHTYNHGDSVILEGEEPTWLPVLENPHATVNMPIDDRYQHSGLFEDVAKVSELLLTLSDGVAA